MALPAGWLNRRLAVFTPTVVDDGYGKRPGPPAPLGTFLADAEPVSDGERARAGQTEAVLTMRFLVRQSRASGRIDATCTLEVGGRTYGVAGVKEALRWKGAPLRRGEAFEISASARTEGRRNDAGAAED